MEVKGGGSKKNEREAKGVQEGKGGREGVKRRNRREDKERRKEVAIVALNPKFACFENGKSFLCHHVP